MLCITLPAGYCLVNPPAEFALNGSISPAVMPGEQVSGKVMTARQAILSGKFLMLWTVFFLNIVAGIMFIGFQSPLLQDLLKKTMDPTTWADPQVVAGLAASGATLIALSSICNGAGRFFWGGLSDKIGRVEVFRFILGSQFFVFIAMTFVENPVIFGALVCYILLCYGGGFGAMPSFVLDSFGPRLMPVLYGSILTAWGCAGIVGPQLVALLKDNFAEKAASYAFLCGAAILLLGFCITFALSNDKLTLASSCRTKSDSGALG
jgi:OFA family oxalate/formate antiporter-like MFS transporter